MKTIEARCVKCRCVFTFPVIGPLDLDPALWPVWIRNPFKGTSRDVILPFHAPNGFVLMQVEPDMPEMCDGSMLAPDVRLIVKARFNPGDTVKVIKLLDTLTTRDLIGHIGVIDEVEPLFNNDFNYEIKCRCDGGHHYMHEEELELVPPTVAASDAATGATTKQN